MDSLHDSKGSLPKWADVAIILSKKKKKKKERKEVTSTNVRLYFSNDALVTLANSSLSRSPK